MQKQALNYKKGVLENFEKFAGKKVACNFIKKEALVQLFPCELCENFKNTFFPEHLRWTAFRMVI